MALFRRNGKPLKFNIVDVEGAELAALTELIVSHGGETTDDEETIVKFTTLQKYGRKSYPRAKIYDVEFIVECTKKLYIVEPEQYRFGKKVPYDECCMLHFLNQENCILERTSLPRVFSPGSTCLVSESDKEIAALLNFAQNSDMFCSNAAAGRLSQMMDIDETLFTQAIKSEPLSSDTVQPINELLPILPSVQTKGYAPLRGCGDVVDSRVDNHEKRPCNLEFEHEVRPKLAAFAEDARKVAAAKETLSILGNRQQPRSPRTRTRRHNGALRPQSPFGLGDTEKLPDSSVQRDKNPSRTYDEEETVFPIKQEVVDIPSDSETPENLSRLRVIPDARQRSLSPPNVEAASGIGWIPTKSARTNETLRGNENSAVSANHGGSLLNPVAISVLRGNSAAKSNDPATSRVLNIRHEGTWSEAISLENTGNPSRADGTKRKHNVRERSGVENNPTIAQQRLTQWEKSGDEGNAVRGKGKQRLRQISGDESTADREKRKNATREKSGDGIDADRGDPSSSNREKRGAANGAVAGRRLLPSLHADLRVRENEYDSSDSSSGRSTPSIKRSRRDGVCSVDSSDDQEFVDAKSDDDASRRTQDDSWNQAGPSGLGNRAKRNHYEDKGSRNDESHRRVSEHSSFITNSDKSDIDDDNENQINAEEIIVEPKIEDFLHPDLRPSRGQVWRSKLVKNHEQAPKYRRHFVPWEKRKMLRYLTERRCIGMAKGLVIWKKMIAEGLLPHRTPQSLQNHFQKSLLPAIEEFDFLEDSDLQEFLALRVETGRK